MTTPIKSQTEIVELATVTVSSRIPEFWCDQPRLWFVQCDAVLSPQKLSDEAKFNLVVTKLGKEVVQQVGDILLKPPETKKYEALRARLLTVYEESETRQFQKLLSEMELGEQKPSQLLRRMKDLAREKIPDDTLKLLWQGHLPSPVRAVLAVTDLDLENLAKIADKILETSKPLQVAEISQPQSNGPTDIEKIMAEISKLSCEVADLRNSRPPYRQHWNANRTRSASRNRRRDPSVQRQRRTQECPDWLCYYHHRFRARARKCVEPCAWKTRQEN